MHGDVTVWWHVICLIDQQVWSKLKFVMTCFTTANICIGVGPYGGPTAVTIKARASQSESSGLTSGLKSDLKSVHRWRALLLVRIIRGLVKLFPEIHKKIQLDSGAIIWSNDRRRQTWEKYGARNKLQNERPRNLNWTKKQRKPLRNCNCALPRTVKTNLRCGY